MKKNSKIIDSLLSGKFHIVFAIACSLLFFLAVYLTCGVWFETNDDVFISELLSGKITGAPEYHIPFVSIFLTAPISALYKNFANIPWWGIFVAAILLVSLAIITYSLISQSKSLPGFILSLVLIATVYFVSIYEVCQIQFTSAAMLLAVSGYLLLIVNDKRKISYIHFFLFELVACATRDSAMMLLQPLCCAMYLGNCLAVSNGYKKELLLALKKTFICVSIALLSICIIKILDFATFTSDEYRYYRKTDDALVYLADYQEEIEYLEIEDVLEKYNIDESDYKQYLNYVYRYPETEFTEECYDELIPRLEKIRDTKDSYFNPRVAIVQQLFSSTEYWHMHQYTAILFVIAVVVAVLFRDWNRLIQAALSFGGYALGIIVLSVRNRYVLRIMLPYYLGASILALLIIVSIINRANKSHFFVVQKVVTTVLIVVILTFSVFIGKDFFAYGRRQNHVVNKTEYDKMVEISDYCNSHSKEKYVIDLSYSRYVSTPVFDTKYYGRTNYFHSGSWYSKNSTVYNYGVEYLKNGYEYIVYEAQEWMGLEGLDYYANELMCSPKLIDKKKLSNGATIWVYHLQKDF